MSKITTMRLIFTVLLCLTVSSICAQNVMLERDKNRVEFHGVTMRPGQVAKTLCKKCELARQHFLKAKKMRSWNIVFSQIGFAEIILSLFKMEEETSQGITHAAIGGSVFFLIEERNKKIQREIKYGIREFNNCHILK